jgi:uncharacterized protein (TIGR02266 family)
VSPPLGRRTGVRAHRRRTVRVLVEYIADGVLCSDPATTLGAGGLFTATESALPEGTSLKLRFRLPGGSGDHEIEGRVAWSHEPAAGGASAPGMGVAFSDPIAAERLALELDALG